MKTQLILVTFFRRNDDKNKLGRTIAFDMATGQVVKKYCRHNSRPYESASAAIRRSDDAQEVFGYFGYKWLRTWSPADVESSIRMYGN